MFSDKFNDLMSIASKFASNYQSADPYPNISFENVFDQDYLDEILAEFPDLSSKDTARHNNPKEIKYGSRGEMFFGSKTKEFMNYLNSEPFLTFLQELTGIKEKLIPDPYYSGGGQHEIKRGGLLKIHSDFNKHGDLKLDRRINVLIYLNQSWKEEYGGHFELWNKDMNECRKKILPIFNTMVIFSTTDYSYHGHPDPLMCPESRSRKSLALYYYSNGRPLSEIKEGFESHSTIFKERGGNESDKVAFSKRSFKPIRDFLILLIPPIVFKVKAGLFGKK